MSFGQVESVESVDFSFPKEIGSLDVEARKHKSFDLKIGLPTFADDQYKVKMYPSACKKADYLKYYAKSYSCLELNSTFYSIPTEEQVAKWAQKVGDSFLFCPKVLRMVSQNINSTRSLHLFREFSSVMQAFGEHLLSVTQPKQFQFKEATQPGLF